MKTILFLFMLSPVFAFGQTYGVLPVERRSKNPYADGRDLVRQIWMNPHLKMCKHLLEQTVTRLRPTTLSLLKERKISSHLSQEVHQIIKNISRNAEPNPQGAMKDSYHWDVGEPYNCRLSVYQGLGQIKAYFPEDDPEIDFKDRRGIYIGQFDAVLSGVSFDFKKNRVTLDPTKTITALQQVFQMYFTGRDLLGADPAFPKAPQNLKRMP